MKNLLTILIGFSLFALVACDQPQDAPATPPDTVPPALETVAEETKSAADATGDKLKDWYDSSAAWMDKSWDSIKNSTYADREDAAANLTKAADYLNKKTEEAGTAISNLSGDAKTQAEKALDSLKSAQKSLSDSASKAANVSEADWDDFQDSVAGAWDKARNSLKSISKSSSN